MKKRYLFITLSAILANWILWAGPFFGPPPQNPEPPYFLSRCEGGKITRDSLDMLEGRITSARFETLREAEWKWMRDSCTDKRDTSSCCPPPILHPDTTKFGKKDKYDGKSAGSIGTGGTDSSCYALTAFLDRNSTSGKWRFVQCATVGSKGNCQCKETPQILTEVQSPESDTSAKKRFYDIVIGLGLKNPYLLDHIPFDYKNHYFEWRKSTFKSQVPDPAGFLCSNHPNLEQRHRYCGNWNKGAGQSRSKKVDAAWGFLVPSKSSEQVWFVCNGLIKPIPELKASWFSEEKNGDLFYQLVVFLIQDPEVRIKPYQSGKKLFLELQGAYKGQDYLIVFSNSGDEYLMVGNADRPEIKQNAALLGNLIHRNDARIRQLVADYVNKGIQGKIDFALPSYNADNPLGAIGNPVPSDTVPPRLREAFASGTPVDLLMFDGTIWRQNGTRIPTWYGKKHSHFAQKCRWLPWLAIADPKLEVIAEDSLVFQFIFREKTDLWSWVLRRDGSVEEHKTINGDKTFLLGGAPLSAYISEMKKGMSPAERSFWLMHPDPNKISLVDVFQLGDKSERTLLLKDNQYDPTAVYRLNQEIAPPQLPIALFDRAGNKQSSFEAIVSLYRQWRNVFYEDLVATDFSEPEAWFGSEKFLTSTFWKSSERRISLRLIAPKRSFLQVSYNNIESLLRKDRGYAFPHDAPLGRKEFYSSILSDDWRKSIVKWRANPLGYLDRALQENF